MSDSSKPLAGRTIAIPETRELDLLASMVEEKGAVAFRCPLVAILDAPDPAPVQHWLAQLADGQFSDVILLTGEGQRRLLGFADRMGTRDAVVAALAKVRKVTRGPKPARALREIGLATDLAADVPTTDGVIAALAGEDLAGRRFGVQLYAQEPNVKLTEFLRERGAQAATVAPYIYAPAVDESRVLELIAELAQGRIAVTAFTSASQVDRLVEVAHKHGESAALEQGMKQTVVAAVGPVVAEKLQQAGFPVAIMPERSYFMRPLVNAIIDAVAAT